MVKELHENDVVYIDRSIGDFYARVLKNDYGSLYTVLRLTNLEYKNQEDQISILEVNHIVEPETKEMYEVMLEYRKHIAPDDEDIDHEFWRN